MVSDYSRYELKNVVIKSYWHQGDVAEDAYSWCIFTKSYEGIIRTYTEYSEEGKPVSTSEWIYVN